MFGRNMLCAATRLIPRVLDLTGDRRTRRRRFARYSSRVLYACAGRGTPPPICCAVMPKSQSSSPDTSLGGASRLMPVLGLASAVAIVVGGVIGSGVFLKPNKV